MHTQQRVVQSSRVRREVRKPVAVTRSTRPPGARWRMAATAMFVGCSVALGGCGGAGGSATPTQPSAQPASVPLPKTTSITFEGDSTVQGTGAPAGQSEPDDLQALIGITVNNAGVAGSTTQQNLAGVTPFNSPLATRLAVDTSQIVIMNYAINDSQKVNLDTYEQNLYDWVRTVRSFGKIPVFEEPNPSILVAYQRVLPDYVAAMDRAAQDLNVPIVKQYDYIQTLPNWQSLLSDGLHPNSEGYRIKAQRTATVLKQVIQALM